MAFCRFSSMDWQCDIYLFEHCDGYYQLYVADNRITSDVPKITADIVSDVHTLFRQHETQMKALHSAVRKKIGGPHDGASMQFNSIEECVVALRMLREEGYIFPDNLIEMLREEQLHANLPVQ